MSEPFSHNTDPDLNEREYKVRIIERLGQLEQRLNQSDSPPNPENERALESRNSVQYLSSLLETDDVDTKILDVIEK